jgi:ribulose 1,5-bisphosphate synthetase/thiazole synthase
MRTNTKTLIEAMRVLSREIKSEDGVANLAIAEAAERIAELESRAIKREQQLLINHEKAEEIIAQREAKIYGLTQRLEKVSIALRDAISTYDPNRAETFVSAERQEAWAEALKS